MIDARQGIGMTSARTRDRLVQRLRDQGIRNEAVLEQIRNVPRHLFVDEALASRAYEDTALPIGLGQTISQPYVVARMTEALLDGFEGETVLEVGTGCGYQTAVLAPLVKKIYTIERIPELLRRARQRLRELDIYNVQFKPGDGWNGWPKYGPYDGIIVTAAPDHVPEKLLEQLAPGGRLIIPVGVAYGSPLEKVLEILTRAAKENSDVLSYPPPNPIFTGFGNSSIDFELRVWIHTIDDRLRIRSELGVLIDRLFREEGIEIPFPQRDLHLRSIDSNLQTLFGAKSQPTQADTEGNS